MQIVQNKYKAKYDQPRLSPIKNERIVRISQHSELKNAPVFEGVAINNCWVLSGNVDDGI